MTSNWAGIVFWGRATADCWKGRVLEVFVVAKRPSLCYSVRVSNRHRLVLPECSLDLTCPVPDHRYHSSPTSDRPTTAAHPAPQAEVWAVGWAHSTR